MSPAQFVLLVALAVPTVVSQDNGWPEWPEWPPSDWPEWPEWPAWKESSADTAPAPVPTTVPVPITMGSEEEDPIIIQLGQVSDLFEAVNVTMDAEEEDAAMAQVSDLFEAVNISMDAEEEAAVTAQVIDVSSGYATVAEALADREDLSFFYDAAIAVDMLQVFQDEDFSTTIFVPTNAAMSTGIATLGFLSFNDLNEYIEKLVEIVVYHIVKDAVVFSGDLEDGSFVNMLSSPVLNTQIDLSDGVAIRGIGSVANVVQADIVAGKSVIHIIDTVLLPFDPVINSEINSALQDLEAFEFESIVQLVEAVPSLAIFGLVAEATGTLYPFLQASNFKVSIFIPSDAAFSKGLQNLGLTSLQALLNVPDVLQTILVNHIITTPITVSELQNDQILKTVGQQTVTVNGAPFLAIVSNGATAKVIDYNIMAGEVVVYIIDDVLLPWEITDDMLEKINRISLYN